MIEQKEKTIDLTLITPCKFNPRKTFDKNGLKELEDSIRKQGVLQAILVRPQGQVSKTSPWHYEIVCGERRFRAATAAGLKEIPARVVNMDDKTALEVQIAENQKRSDLHPLEEAEGYEQLMKKHNETVDEIAAKVGKSGKYVYQRIRLLDLIPDCRKMFYEGTLTAGTALLIARMPKDLQKEAALAITEDRWEGPMSLKRAQRHIEQNFMLELKDVKFSKDDTICPKAGPCSKCPKRTGNNDLLFADVKGGDRCTDPKCFAEKKNAWGQHLLEKAKKSGATIIPTKDVFTAAYSDDVGGGYVNLQSTCYEAHEYKKYGELLKRVKTLKPSVTVDKRGNVIEIVKKSDALKAFKDAGIKMASSSGSSSGKSVAEQRQEKNLKDAIHGRIMDEIMRMIKIDLKQSFWPALAKASFDRNYDDAQCFIANRIIPGTKRQNARSVVETHIKKLSIEDARLFTIECFLASQFCESSSTLSKLYAINEKAIEKEVKARMDEPKAKAKR